jgi:3-methyladenine DNA glycosylase AlkD
MPIRNKVHQEIIDVLDILVTKSDQKERLWVQKYLGSNKPTRCIKTGELQKLSKRYLPNIDLINSLYQNGKSFDEFVIAANLAGRVKDIDLKSIDKWLNYTVGWAEVDSLCQSNFTADKVLPIWPSWKKLLTALSIDKNINKRRASLVLLCKTLGQSDDGRVSDFTFELVNKLKSEKEILITKAVSWVLRQLVRHHPDELAVYLEDNRSTLPKIAYREALKKLITGKKN